MKMNEGDIGINEVIRVLRKLSWVPQFKILKYLSAKDIDYTGADNDAELYLLYYLARKNDGLESVDADDFGDELN